jgi:hypothetical protein
VSKVSGNIAAAIFRLVSRSMNQYVKILGRAVVQ